MTSKAVKERIAEVKKMLGNTRRLTSEQYVEMLEEAQLGLAVHLVELTLLGLTKDSAALTTALDRVHWLLDSARGKTGGKTEGKVVTVNFLPANKDKDADSKAG